MRTLGMVARRHKGNIKKAVASWDKLRSGFGASSGAAAGKMLVNRTAGKDTPSAKGNYWLERADPLHQSWGHQGTDLFDEWYRSESTKSFWEWLDANGKGNFPGVQYLAPDERWRHWVVFSNDRKLWSYDAGSADFARFSTRAHSTAFSGAGFAIYVCSPGGTFYTGSHKVSEFHHSSFLAGGRVMGAGEWVVSNGVILLMTHKTGHYQASPRNLLDTLHQLKQRTSIDRTIVAVTDYATNTTVHVNANDWIKANGNTAACARVQNIDPVKQARLRCSHGIDWDNAQNNVYVGDQPVG